MSQRLRERGVPLRRRHFLIGGAASAGAATAGCLDWFRDDETDAMVPANANVLGEFDTAVFDHEPSRDLIDMMIADGPNVPGVGLLETLLEEPDTPDLDAVSDATLFGEADEDLSLDLLMAGAILEADWEVDELVGALETHTGIEYASTDYHGDETLYEPTEDLHFTEPLYLGVIDDGEYVIGDETGATSVLDVALDDADSASSELVDTLDESPDGYGSIAMVPPRTMLPKGVEEQAAEEIDPSVFEEVDSLHATYDAEGTTIDIQSTVFSSDSTAAGSQEILVSGAFAMLSGEVEPEIATEIDKIDVSQDGDTVEIHYESEAELAALLLDEILSELIGAGAGGDPQEIVPEFAHGVGSIDPDLLDDNEFQEMTSSLVAFFREELEGDGPEPLDLIDLTAFEEHTDLALEEVNEFVGFMELAEEPLGPPAAFGNVFTANWEGEDVIAGIESFLDDDLVETEYHGDPVLYEPSGEDIVLVGQLGVDEFVIGDRRAVEGVLDVRLDDADTVGENVMNPFDAAGDGDLVGGLDLTESEMDVDDVPGVDLEPLHDIEAINISYEQEAESVDGASTLFVENEESADGVESLINLLFEIYDGEQQVEDEIEKIEMDQEELTVHMTYESDPAGAQLLIENASDILDV